jgi:hypothetical protein
MTDCPESIPGTNISTPKSAISVFFIVFQFFISVSATRQGFYTRYRAVNFSMDSTAWQFPSAASD